MSRLHRTIAQVEGLLGRFQIGEAGRRLQEFFWGEFCDWYLEMAKVRLRAGDSSPLPVLAYVLDMSLRLLHPIMPFVTEAAWQHLRPFLGWAETDALIVAPWPKASRAWIDPEAEAQASLAVEVVRAIRNLRARWRVEPGRAVEAYVATPQDHSLRPLLPVVAALARTHPLHLVADPAQMPRRQAAIALVDGAQVSLPLAGLLDLDQERQRLQRQLQETEQEVAQLQERLANPDFRARAPQEVVAREEGRLSQARQRLQALQERLQELG
jgi:valyl-tRNA synthetase